MSVKSLSNKRNLSAIEIKQNNNVKIKFTKTKKINPKRYNSSCNLKKNTIKKLSKNLSNILFQNNDVDFVRSLNIDKERNLCDNELYKEQLINKLGIQENFNKHEKSLNQNNDLPIITKLTINDILENEKQLNIIKKEDSKIIANTEFEKELYKKLKEIRNHYTEIKKKKNELYNKYQNIMNEINNINLDLQILELTSTDSYFNKEYELKKKLLEMKRMQREEFMYDFNSKISNRNNKNQKNMNNCNVIYEYNMDMNNFKDRSEDKNEEKMKKIKTFYLVKKDQKEKKNKKNQQIKKYKKELKEIDDKINILNKELTESKKQEKDLIQKLMNYYQALLFKGKDIKNEGLIWIIKAMWNIGKNVPMQFIPNFLDFKSIDFLFKLANKSTEIENKKKLLTNQKKNINIKLHKFYYYNNNINDDKNKKFSFSKTLYGNPNKRSSLVFKMNFIKNNTVLKNSVSQTNIIKTYMHSNADEDEENNKNKQNTFKQLSMMFNKKNKNLDKEKISGMNDIENMKNKIKEIEAEVENLKKIEIKRIFKEFIENDYQNKYNVSIDVVLGALLGEHRKNIEINKYEKFKREYFESIKNLRFYEPGKNRQSSY